MTNPDNIIRLHSRAGGRGSVYEANAPYQVYSTGMFSGTGTSPNTSPDMNIIVGGGDKPASPTNPHIVVGENPQGYKVMLDIVGTTILQATAPATNKRYTAVVVYANDLSESSTDATTTGSPSQNGVILVNGPAAASPRMPNDSEIRAAITDDGGTGTQAVYAIIAAPVISSTTTTITDTNRQHSYLNNNVVSDDIARMSDIPEIKQPYVASVSSKRSNTTEFSMTAPNPKSGYKFLCWIYVTTSGAVASWNAEIPTNRTTKFWFVQGGDWNSSASVIGYALYVPS